MDIVIELSAVVISVRAGAVRLLCLMSEERPALASGMFRPQAHRTFDLAVREFVREQTGFDTGYVEQLYSFGDDGRKAQAVQAREGLRVISVGYLALTPHIDFKSPVTAEWVGYERFFPWEDRRIPDDSGYDSLRTELLAWARDDHLRALRVATLFPENFENWNEERVLDRYELLYEAGFVAEAGGTQRGSGDAMASDHRRILATGLSRLRGKIKYRPVVFELMPESFTLLELQKCCEGVSGLALHKANFRRALDRTGLVVGLKRLSERTGGRPAELFSHDSERFRFSSSLGLSLPRA